MSTEAERKPERWPSVATVDRSQRRDLAEGQDDGTATDADTDRSRRRLHQVAAHDAGPVLTSTAEDGAS